MSERGERKRESKEIERERGRGIKRRRDKGRVMRESENNRKKE